MEKGNNIQKAISHSRKTHMGSEWELKTLKKINRSQTELLFHRLAMYICMSGVFWQRAVQDAECNHTVDQT